MNEKQTAIITLAELPEDTSRKYFIGEDFERIGLKRVYVHLGNAYAELRCIDRQTAMNASVLDGCLEDHLDAFEVVE